MSFNYYPSSYRSLEASLSTSASRSTAGSIVLSLDRNKPVTIVIPTTLLDEPKKGLAPGWSPKKTKRENVKKVVKKKNIKHEVGNINSY